MKMSTQDFQKFLRESFPQCTESGLYEDGHWDVYANPPDLGIHEPDVVIASGRVTWNHHGDWNAPDAVDTERYVETPEEKEARMQDDMQEVLASLASVDDPVVESPKP